MTDITDQDRRAARAWAKNWQGDLDADTSAAARVILATVDATDPTLAEELARIAENSPVWTIKNVRDELKSAAARAKRTEHDLAEASAEVERLTAVNENLRRTDNYREFRERFLTVQKGAESPDPADVPPGEAWLVRDEQELSIAVRDAKRWVLTHLKDATTRYRSIQHITLIARLVPAPRVITNPVDLDRMPEGTIIQDHADGEAMQKFGNKWVATRTEHHEGFYSFAILPATVLWEPEA